MMIEGGKREAGSFGKRRIEDRPETWQPDASRAGEGGPPSPRRGALSWALRTAALVGLGSVLATQVLVRGGAPDASTATHLAQARRTVPLDPETTGAIGGEAGDRSTTRVGCGPLIACLHTPPGRLRP